MPNIRLWGTDLNGNPVLRTTIVLDKHLNKVDVIHHTSEEVRAEQRKKNTERVKRAFEDLAKQNPEGVLKALSEQ